MKAVCHSRPALLGTPLRQPASAARRQRSVAGRLQVQALKIKWNEQEKPSSSQDEGEGNAPETSKPGTAPATGPAPETGPTSKAAARLAAAAADDKAAEAKAAQAKGTEAKAAPAAKPAASSSNGSNDLAATVKEVAAKLGVIPSSPPASSPAQAAPAKASSAAPAAPAAPATAAAGGADGRGAQAGATGSGTAGAAPAADLATSSFRPEVSVIGAEAKLAVAAKISAARTLARKLAEEKQAALAASRLASVKAVDPDTAKQMVQSAENEVAELAKEAARADSMARAAKKAELGHAQQLELQRLKAENETLQQLLVQLAADRNAAEAKLKEVKERYSSTADLESLKQELDAGKMPAALADLAAAATAAPPAAAPAAAAAAPAAAVTAEAPAAPAAAAAQAAPPPPPPPPPKPSHNQLQQLAAAAVKAGKKIFTLPDGPAVAGQPCTVYYDRSRGPLPGGSAVALKLGLNKWESIEVIPMQRCSALAGEWWQVELQIPSLLFKVDFVTMDTHSGAVDNNNGKDFQLALSGAVTEQELQMKRMQLLEAYEQQRVKELRIEEDRIYAEWMKAAEDAAKEARKAYHARRREQLMQEALAVVSERRGAALQSIATVQSREGVFQWLPSAPEAGGVSTLVYNKATGPMRNSSSTVFLHIGYDGWWLKDKRVIAMTPLSDADVLKYKLPKGKWVAAEVPAWNTAAMLDYVFSDDRRAIWDNNGGKDFHTLLQNPASGDKLVQLVFEALDTATSGDTGHQEEVAAKRVMDKAHTKAIAGRRRREIQSRYMFTKPLTPVAGQPVEIYYNPDETPLRGRPDIYVSTGFNRWTHPDRLQPVQMEPVVAGGIGWHRATVQMPTDAHVLDLAFIDSADTRSGFYDNNKGLDYHVQVKGGTGSMPALRVVHVAAEMAPIAKEGGLGDVVTALGRAVQEEGHEVEVVLPKYDCINYNSVQKLRMVKDFWLDGVQVKIWKGYVEDLATTFLEPCNGYFWKGKIYTDIWADRERFYYWCGCALEYIKHHADNRQPDMIHCHDWQSAPVAWLDHGSAKTAFTIHNLNYGADLIGQAMAATDVATTVSPTYREEISGNPAVAPHYTKFFGIRNGIDPDIWDPAEDALLPRGYTADDVIEGKAAAKAELRKRMKLSNADVPVVGVVTRLTHQKGIHLIKHAAWRSLERGAQFVLLGSAPDPKVQAEFQELSNQLAEQYPDRARLWFAYDEPLSHLIYAGCDIFLVPSVFEPCGLTQMIAMRYGTIPVVRKTGGLNDTVFDVDHDEERAKAGGMEVNGFSFEGMDEGGMDYALNRALSRFFGERDWWNMLAKRVMQMDWSWNSPALDYLELYYRALKK